MKKNQTKLYLLAATSFFLCTGVFAQQKKDNKEDEEETSALDKVVVSASRTPERIRSAPVAIERLDAKDLQVSATPTFYDAIGKLKGVTITNNGLNSQTVNARGFNRFGNSFFVQLLDGMDTSTPSLNVPLANINGTNELDVGNIEVIPGAASVLYSARALTGLISIEVKDPFLLANQGVSAYTKVGVTRQDAQRGSPLFTDNAFRIAKAWNDKIAVKLNVGFLDGNEFRAVDYTDADGDPRRVNQINNDLSQANGKNPNNINKNPSYDGVNVYGDEYFYPTNFHRPVKVSRIGYKEEELFPDNRISNLRGDIGIYAKLFENVKASYVFKIGRGDFQYQSATRFMIRDYVNQQHKIQLEGPNWVIRTAYGNEDAGRSVAAALLGFGVNTYSGDGIDRSSKRFIEDYMNKVVDTPWGSYQGASMTDPKKANYAEITNYLKLAAESRDALGNLQHKDGNSNNLDISNLQSNRLVPGTAKFNDVLLKLKNQQFGTDGKNNGSLTGARFYNTSSLHDTNGYYNFKDAFNWIDIQVGGSYRKYFLRSKNEIFWDTPNNPIQYEEYSGYTQLTKKFNNDRLKFGVSALLTGSSDYGNQISPRFSINYDVDAAKKHNLRFSYIQGVHYPENAISFLQINAIADYFIGTNKRTLDQYRLCYSGYDLANKMVSDPADPTSLISNTYKVSQGDPNYNNTGAPLYVAGGTYNGAKIGADGSIDANFILKNAYTENSYLKYIDEKDAGNPNARDFLKRAKVDPIKAITMEAFEFGYRGSIGKRIDMDFNAYWNVMSNFTNIYAMYFNTGYGNDTAFEVPDFKRYYAFSYRTDKVTVRGFNVGVNYAATKRFKTSINYEFTDFAEGMNAAEFAKATDEQLYRNGPINYFNTPKHQVKGSIGTRGFSLMKKKLALEVNARWTDDVYFVTEFASGFNPANTVLDASASYKLNSHFLFKVVGTNILNHDYLVARGSAKIGSVYYLGLTVNL